MAKNRLYKSSIKGKKESLRDFSPDENQLFVRIESASEYPNYYFRELGADLKQATFFLNPFKSLQNIHKESILRETIYPAKISEKLAIDSLKISKAISEKLKLLLKKLLFNFIGIICFVFALELYLAW